MNGLELEQLMSLGEDRAENEILQFVRDHRDEVLKQLQDEGMATFFVGSNIIRVTTFRA